MIVKKVPNPKKSASKAQRIGQLTSYVRSPESESPQEKCLYAGARGFMMDEIWSLSISRFECLHPVAGGFIAGEIYQPRPPRSALGCPDQLVDHRRAHRALLD